MADARTPQEQPPKATGPPPTHPTCSTLRFTHPGLYSPPGCQATQVQLRRRERSGHFTVTASPPTPEGTEDGWAWRHSPSVCTRAPVSRLSLSGAPQLPLAWTPPHTKKPPQELSPFHTQANTPFLPTRQQLLLMPPVQVRSSAASLVHATIFPPHLLPCPPQSARNPAAHLHLRKHSQITASAPQTPAMGPLPQSQGLP